jgi:hypothetical protein
MSKLIRRRRHRIELVSDDLTPSYEKNFHASKLYQSTRVAKIDVFCMIRPFKRRLGVKND